MNDSRGYADQLNIETPEQVDLRFPIAGIGSRFLALLTDSVLQGAAVFILIMGFVLILSAAPRVPGAAISSTSSTAAKWIIAGVVLFYFLLYWGYYSLFE